MKKAFTVKNKKGQIIRGVIERYGTGYGPVVIFAHGLLANKNQPQIRETARLVAMQGYTTVRFSATNNIGRSSGSPLHFTVGGYVMDCSAVIEYALRVTKQSDYYFVGYSIGAMVGYIIAATDRRMKGMVLQGPVYDLAGQMERYPKFKLYKKIGWMLKRSRTLKKDFKLGFEFYREGVQYDVDAYLVKVKCPTLVIYGSQEKRFYKKRFQQLYKKISARKELVMLPKIKHVMRSKKHIAQFSDEIIQWLQYQKK